MKIIIVIVSFLLEGVISNFISINGYLAPLFTLVSLIMIYPLFEESTHYYKYAFLTGLAYDLFYTDTIIFHAIIFCFMAFIIMRLNLVLSDNFINVLIIIALSILVYRVLTYGLLVFINSMDFDFKVLGFSILKSMILNLFYGSVLFVLIQKFKKKRKYNY